jgi:predicted house-cleaning noncanonical NTP pyrophosphatase (MazG superfamily)
MPIYNKLVRDRIPEVISKSGKHSVTRILSNDEYKLELQKKLGEEIQEYIEAADDNSAIEELADLLELIHAALELHGSNVQELEQVRREKAEQRGGFKEKIFLVEVTDA